MAIEVPVLRLGRQFSRGRPGKERRVEWRNFLRCHDDAPHVVHKPGAYVRISRVEHRQVQFIGYPFMVSDYPCFCFPACNRVC